MSIEENKPLVCRYQVVYRSNEPDRLTEVLSENLLTPNIMPGIPHGVEHWGEEDSVSLMQQLGVLKM